MLVEVNEAELLCSSRRSELVLCEMLVQFVWVALHGPKSGGHCRRGEGASDLCTTDRVFTVRVMFSEPLVPPFERAPGVAGQKGCEDLLLRITSRTATHRA